MICTLEIRDICRHAGVRTLEQSLRTEYIEKRHRNVRRALLTLLHVDKSVAWRLVITVLPHFLHELTHLNANILQGKL